MGRSNNYCTDIQSTVDLPELSVKLIGEFCPDCEPFGITVGEQVVDVL
ncbi:MAG: hypothetical protein VB933_09570 [Pseudomonadales bacterium]